MDLRLGIEADDDETNKNRRKKTTISFQACLLDTLLVYLRVSESKGGITYDRLICSETRTTIDSKRLRLVLVKLLIIEKFLIRLYNIIEEL